MIGPPRRLAAALTGVGVLLCVLGWYQASGQPTVAQQIPYLASATIPGAALLAAGAAALLRPSAAASATSKRSRAIAAAADGRSAVGGRSTGAEAVLFRVPDGRYVHATECPLLDGRTDAVELGGEEAATAELRPCPLCQASLDSAAGPG
ncbi:hypothetical protein [Actinospica robiniae]|uniref:hypothetical protein n=1 Tax=Actinospica robiniae TaxID=304901 RepID=UPI0004121A36|nr:hypothetical protein [Actinospica robiniae]